MSRIPGLALLELNTHSGRLRTHTHELELRKLAFPDCVTQMSLSPLALSLPFCPSPLLLDGALLHIAWIWKGRRRRVKGDEEEKRRRRRRSTCPVAGPAIMQTIWTKDDTKAIATSGRVGEVVVVLSSQLVILSPYFHLYSM
jgi:hypothetical protein